MGWKAILPMSDRTVLALDLSSPRGVIAVVRGDAVLFEAVFQSERSHNAQVFAPLVEALAVIGQGSAVIGQGSAVIAVGTGPGSYTGVRISIAAAQGLALSRGWPVVGWPTIAALDLPEYHVLGDARRGHFYTAAVSQGKLLAAPLVVTAEAARQEVEAGGEWLTLDAKVPLDLADVRLCQPDAVALARRVLAMPEREIAERAAALLEPVYLQDAFITTAKKAGKAVPRLVVEA